MWTSDRHEIFTSDGTPHGGTEAPHYNKKLTKGDIQLSQHWNYLLLLQPLQYQKLFQMLGWRLLKLITMRLTKPFIGMRKLILLRLIGYTVPEKDLTAYISRGSPIAKGSWN